MEFMLFDVEGEEKKYTRTYTDDDKVEQTTGSRITHRFNNISRNDKALFRKELDAMFAACSVLDQSSPVKLLTQVVLVKIVHNTSEDGKTTYVNLELADCMPPFENNRLGEADMTKPLALPVDPKELQLKLFVWSAPSIQQWATIEIEGTFTTKDEAGKEVEKSKNWIQELIQKAENFGNSPIESLLLQAGNTGTPLPKATKAANATKAPETTSEDVSTSKVGKGTKKVSKVPQKAAQEASEVSEPVGETLTEDEAAKLLQYEQMVDMCKDTGQDAKQFEDLRDALIAKRDGA